MTKTSFGLILILLFLSCEQQREPSATQLTVALDTTFTTIGDVVLFSVTVEGRRNELIHFPPLQLKEPIEVRGAEETDLVQGRGVVFELVFWDTGSITIPPYAVQILNSDSTIKMQLVSDSLFINVVSVTDADPNYRQKGNQLRPIKGPVPVKIPWSWQRIGLFSALFFTLAGMIWTWSHRIRNLETPVIKKQVLQKEPDLYAREQLELLEKDLNIEGISVNEFYTRLSLITREYIETSLYIRTLSMTTEEIRANQALFPYNNQEFDGLIVVLNKADLVKFAGMKLQRENCITDLENIRTFIEKTAIYWKFAMNGSEPGYD